MNTIKENETERILIEMLKENTGTHMLDSGGETGRHWQRNQQRDFSSEPGSNLEFHFYAKGHLSISYTRKVLPYLSERLTFNRELNNEFQHFLKSGDFCYLEAMEEFCRVNEFEFSTVNTYNGECNLDQTLQYTAFGRTEFPDHVLLQIHGGCDVRGGYTKPVVFNLKNEMGLFDVADGIIRCSHCKTYWQTDDNVHWYREGACGLGAGTKLNDYDVESGVNGKKGVLVVTEDSNAFCPVCGQGQLQGE